MNIFNSKILKFITVFVPPNKENYDRQNEGKGGGV